MSAAESPPVAVTSPKALSQQENAPARTDDRQVQKANESIAIRPKKGKLTLLSRRIYNALLYHAQLQGVDAKQYTLPLARLLGDAHFNSRNVALLKEHLREMQTTLIEWNTVGTTEQRWTSTQLLGAVEIAERGPGYPVIITWSYSDKIREQLLRPTRYTRILLEMGAQMRSYAAAVLFELGMQYLTSPSRLTMREDVFWWASVLTGRSDIQRVDYRYFKRDVLRSALAEVDALQDEFSLELIEHREGRKVTELQFLVKRKTQSSLAVTEERNTFDLELVDRLRRIGLKDEEAQRLYSQIDEALLRSTVEHVEQRIRNTALPTLNSPVAYLRDALRRGYADTSEVPAQEDSRASVMASMQALRDEWDREQAKLAKEHYALATEESQSIIKAEFEAQVLETTLEPVVRAWRKDGPKSRVAGPVFYRWMATRESSDPPTEGQLLEFALSKGLLTPART